MTQITAFPEKMRHPVEPLSAVKRREFSGEWEAVQLVDWLNEKPRTKKKERVMQLLRLLAESVRIQKATGSDDYQTTLLAARPINRRIRRLLATYKFTPDLRLTWQGTLLSSPPWRLPRLFARVPSKEERGLPAYGDHAAVWAIIRLCELGRFRAIHACDGCGQWMFAKRTDNATCSVVCRARKMRNDMPKWRQEQVRQRAKDRYWKKKLEG